MFLLGEEQNYLKICLTHNNQSLHTDNQILYYCNLYCINAIIKCCKIFQSKTVFGAAICLIFLIKS